jgi:hypothetical protein
MTQQTESALRTALNRVDSDRKRTTVTMYAMLLMTFTFWGAMMFAKDDHQGLPFGLAAVMGSVFVAGMIASRASHDSTRAILKAIELLAEENRKV